jgi:protein CpxP
MGGALRQAQGERIFGGALLTFLHRADKPAMAAGAMLHPSPPDPGGPAPAGNHRRAQETHMTRHLLTLIAAGGLLAFTALATGCGRHHHRDPAQVASFVGARVDDLLDDLNATDAQRTQTHALKDRLLADGLKLHGEGEPVHAEVLAQWNSPTVDRARLHALVDERMDAFRAFAHEAVDAGADFHDLLTPDQRAKVAKKVERMHKYHP